jgi:DNA replication and repair protein RecF
MLLERLNIHNLRRIQRAELELGPGLNVFIGANGAGKTSLIEAIYLMGYGRSFRGRVRDGLVRSGQPALEVFVQWQDQTQLRRAGLRHTGADWEGRIDGVAIKGLSELCSAFPTTLFEPGSHELLSGGPEQRRQFLDWALFHVEPEFLLRWRRYQRALKQRNSLLKNQPAPALLDSWDIELVENGEWLSHQREAYLHNLLPFTQKHSQQLLNELGQVDLLFSPGWKREQHSLADALLLNRERDITLGYTSVGPHRCDWQLAHASRPNKEALSRGQEKLSALACVLGQSEQFASRVGAWPVLCLDDVASELDVEHQARVVSTLKNQNTQVILTALYPPQLWLEAYPDATKFHVEHGEIHRIAP